MQDIHKVCTDFMNGCQRQEMILKCKSYHVTTLEVKYTCIVVV